MKPTPAAPVAALLTAVALSTTGLVVAVIADGAVVRVLGVLLATVVPFAALAVLRSARPVAARIGVFLIPAVLLGLGIPVVGAISAHESLSSGTPSGGAARDSDTGVTQRLPDDPQARLAHALDRADELIPDGSARLLEVDLDERSTRVVVYDPNNGDAVTSSGSEGRWYTADRRRASHRRTFSRADLANLDLNAATGRVKTVAEQLRLSADDVHPADGITLERRTDDLLVAEYTVAFRPIQVDMNGQVADTVGAAFLDQVLPLAEKTLRARRLDPSAPIIGEVDFRTITEGSSPIAASAIQNSGGFAIDMNSGPYSSIVVVPGCFPLATARSSAARPGFALSAVTTDSLIRARDDLLARNDLPEFDGDVAAFALGPAPGNREQGAVLRLQVGPGQTSANGIYTLDGRFLRDGRW